MTAKPPPLAIPKSTSPPSFLPLPRALRQNRSFAQLTRLLGISAPKEGTDSGSEAGDDDDDDENRTLSGSGDDDGDPNSDVDEESLMWDAQTALIAHQPALAAKYYATAALPPYCSSAACLALGNLLARGSGLSQSESESPAPPQSAGPTSPTIARSPQTSWFTSLFRTTSPPPSSPTVERRPSFLAQGWSMPTDGKRAVRDVEGMGKAGGWLILGIGWIIDTELPHGVTITQPARDKPQHDDGDDDDMIIFSKGKGRARSYEPPVAASTGSSDESIDIATPDDEEHAQTAGEKIKLLYNLLTPLLHLYRHGHIQHHDPVALPPLAPSQLPEVLRPQGDNEKGRNVWSLGSTVAAKVLELPLLSSRNLTKDELMKRDGIVIIANYIRGITSSPKIAEACFKTILRNGPSGLEVPDDLLRQAYRRLNVLLKTTGGSPLSPSELEAYPFPLTPTTGRSFGRKPSATSLLSLADSMAHSSLRLMTPVKSTASFASLTYEPSTIERQDVDGGGAMRSLRNVQRYQRKLDAAAQRQNAAGSSHTWWPSLHGWTMSSAPRTTLPPVEQERSAPAPAPPAKPEDDPFKKDKRPIRVVASSPQLTTNRRLPFEPTEAVASIDPELAALELASALTKHVTCSVCGAGGVNFPNCRKCGLTFCSRKCRVDEKGAGDGKKHICGAWESRRLLHPTPPPATTLPVAPLSKVH